MMHLPNFLKKLALKIKPIIIRLKIGFKKGYNTPTLPNNILKFQSLIYIRIFRFLGGISFLFILSKHYSNYNVYVLYVCFFLSLLFTIYHIIITYYRFKHIIKILRSDELDIRNSPLDRLASLAARAILCTKGICDSAQPVGLGLGLMLSADEVLKHANREPIFGPYLGAILNTVLPETQKSLMNTSKDISEALNNIDNNGQEIQTIESIVEKFKASNAKGDITFEEFKELQEILNTSKESLITDNEEIKAQIKKYIEDYNKKK